MAHLPDILNRIQENGGWMPCDFESRMETGDTRTEGHSRVNSPEEYDVIWRHSVGVLLDSVSGIIEIMNDGLEHAGLLLEIIPRPGKKNFLGFMPGVTRDETTDLEAKGQTIKPGHPQFSRILEEKLREFTKRRVEALTSWAKSEGLTSAQLERLNSQGEFDEEDQPAGVHVHRDRQQLYLILYVQHMVSNMHMMRYVV
jgi:hypothetical protein